MRVASLTVAQTSVCMRGADFKRCCVDNIRLAAKMKFRVFAAALVLVGGQHAETALPTPIGIPRIENLDGLDQFDFSASSTLIHPCLTDPLLGLASRSSSGGCIRGSAG